MASENVVQTVVEENERLQQENLKLKDENQSLSAMCQSLAKNVDELEEEKNARLPPNIESVNNDLQRLHLQANDQLKDIQQQLNLERQEVARLRYACQERDTTLVQRDQRITELERQQRNPQQAALDEILKQCQDQMSGEKRQYEKLLNELQEALQAKNQEIESYQAQLKIYMDDFTAEHRERGSADQKVKRLEEELSLTKELLNQYTNQHMTSARQRRQEAVERIRREYYGNIPEPSYGPLYRSRGPGIVVCDGEDETPIGDDEDIIDSLVEPDSDGGNSPAPAAQAADLQCPKCSRGYSIQQHSDFLEHIDTCCT